MEIVALEASGSYTRVHLQNGRCILLSKTLKSLAVQLEGKHIFLLRIHRSCSLNLSFISKWESDGKGAWISTADGKRWRTSSLRKQQLQDTLLGYFEAA